LTTYPNPKVLRTLLFCAWAFDFAYAFALLFFLGFMVFGLQEQKHFRWQIIQKQGKNPKPQLPEDAK